MKKVAFIISYSVYIAIVVGFILHTSAHPQILGRYTLKYLILLLILIAGFFPFLWWIKYLQRTSLVKFKKRKYTLTPVRKILALIILIVIVIAPVEIFLRNKYKDYESNTYAYTIDNFNPFLQSQIAKQENLTVNSLGFRGEEISAVKPKGTFRIVVLGGSTVLNREVPFEENAVRVLEKELRNHYKDKKIEVINAGKDYYTSEHSLIQYMFKIEDLSPDLVIMWHGANDMGASCTSEGVVTHGEYKSDYSHLFGAVSNIVFNYFKPQPVIQIKLVSLDFALKTLKDNLYSDITNALKEEAKKQITKDYMENNNTVSVHDFPSIIAYERNLLYLINLTKEEGIPLILGNQPSVILKDNNTEPEVEKIIYPALNCTKDGKYYDLNSLKFGLTLFNKETESVAKQNDVMFIDLNSDIPKDLNYFVDGYHYTPKKNQKIADSLYNFIIERDLIK